MKTTNEMSKGHEDSAMSKGSTSVRASLVENSTIAGPTPLVASTVAAAPLGTSIARTLAMLTGSSRMPRSTGWSRDQSRNSPGPAPSFSTSPGGTAFRIRYRPGGRAEGEFLGTLGRYPSRITTS